MKAQQYLHQLVVSISMLGHVASKYGHKTVDFTLKKTTPHFGFFAPSLIDEAQYH